MAPTPSRRTPLSLLITGLAGAWSAAQEESRRPGERWGLILMVTSAASFALMAALAKKLLPDTPTQAVVLSRSLLMTAIFVVAARRQHLPLIGSRPAVLLLRGLLGYCALSCYFYSVQHLPLGDAVLLQYSHPLFIAAIAPWFLKERTSRSHWPLVLVATIGVALIVGPSGDLRGQAFVGLLGSAFAGLAYMAVRQLSRSEHPLTILVWFPAASIPFSLVASIAAGRAALPRGWFDVMGHLAVTATALIGQWTLTQGLARVAAAGATAVTMTGPVFGLLFGLVLFGTVPTAWSLLGTAIVTIALVLLTKGPSPVPVVADHKRH